jgi:hypothetical protein
MDGARRREEGMMDSDVDMNNVYEHVSNRARKERVNALTSDFIAKGRVLLAQGKPDEVVKRLTTEVVPQLQKWGEL